jgi:hypothetical protein
MRKRLARSVHLFSPDGEVIVFLPGDEPSAEYAKQITNPAAWESEDAPAPPPSDGNYEDHTVQDLLTQARERNIDLSGASKKADIIRRLEEADVRTDT